MLNKGNQLKKNLFFVSMLFAVCVGLNMSSANAAAGASTNTAVGWPDYHAKPWVLGQQRPMTVTVPHGPKGNEYVVAYQASIGFESWYFDNADPDQAKTAVIEGNILGNGPVVRKLFVADVGAIDFQINMNGIWKSVPPARVSFVLVDEDSAITKNTMAGAIVRVTDEDGKVLLEVRFYNKNKKK